jgi:hypothetical protein
VVVAVALVVAVVVAVVAVVVTLEVITVLHSWSTFVDLVSQRPALWTTYAHVLKLQHKAAVLPLHLVACLVAAFL